ncbi:MAG TPA: SAM-dependent methyltransferase [Acidiphilium sp.]|jgi:SAM-dependent MidA family methyltransferase|uniref:class I SAM-dependent methyltransferase n=1 Tax=unclassified Acidiphilium TaxID=2617493 RepID=UPI000BD8D233|nr:MULTISPECIES: SAM-dependent methyltransferase [unclassified Acidiphilium]OYV55521.1 MAG: SAM-dependent methyltransferase [Acidiphilium sp. 20-67-58]HQT61732.1 SAM-dependent methyltransferase [Acidiphilium sp.]HQU11158.1 SAM-dependent methyltransferase [Acidiphilium sp.]
MIERLDAFMARANAAYYAECDPFRDFTTAPEISQIFGELIGLWAAVTWRMLGRPAVFSLVEAGPGNGHLMADALRAAGRAVPAFTRAAEIHLIETSPRLIALLRQKLPQATIHPDLSTIPDRPILLVANEFLDALPIRQFVRRGSAWHERYVADGDFIEMSTDLDLPDAPDGAIIERSEGGDTFVRDLAARIAKRSGAALLIDYGHDRGGAGATLQAIESGRPADPLAYPGRSDLTAHVDFARMAMIARQAGADIQGPLSQGAFLATMGIHERTAQLGRHAKADDAMRLLAATQRLTAPEAMGSLFRVMALAPRGFERLPGFLS